MTQFVECGEEGGGAGSREGREEEEEEGRVQKMLRTDA